MTKEENASPLFFAVTTTASTLLGALIGAAVTWALMR